jgi:threonine dehydrogenase-like Zn-dependent dehydrogenase
VARDVADLVVVGAGTVGVLTALAIRRLANPGRVIVAAKHPRQRAAAKLVGATEVVRPEHAVKAVRRGEHAVKLTPERGQEFLLGGVDVAIECVGSKSSLDLALRTTRAGGRVVLSGLPGGGADLTPLWFRELELVGTYASSGEAFPQALELVGHDTVSRIAKSVASYPLHRWREALDHAHGAGRLGSIKVAFDPRRQGGNRS